ncbi:MAG: galactose-1-phosphate uridylyltransferase [Candidatus Aminicenantales bacterium]
MIRTELRRDRLSGHWVLIAPGRAERPSDFLRSRRDTQTRDSRASCPFCEGREKETPPEVEALRKAGSGPDGPGWRVRVVPNKFPALTSFLEAPAVEICVRGITESAAGVGVHEVVADSPDHDKEWADLPVGHIRDIFRIFRSRLRVIASRPGIRYIQIFKNKGAKAGASLHHPHTQILALPFVPRQIGDEINTLKQHRRTDGQCYFCRLIAEEDAGPRIISLDRDFAALAPFASRFPYETHVLPRRHSPRFADTTDEELAALARTMKSVFHRIREAASDPAFHLVLRQAPLPRPARSASSRPETFAHWRFEILPVLGAVAGFEWGTGCFINPVPPERAAAALRGSR